MTHLDENAFNDALTQLRRLQAQRHKLTLKRTKSDRDYMRLEQMYDAEQELYDTLQDINPDFLRN